MHKETAFEEQSRRNERFIEFYDATYLLMVLLVKLKVRNATWSTRGFVTRWMEKYEPRKR